MKPDQLCMFCDKATNYKKGCEFVKSIINGRTVDPVPGWIAVKTKDTYLVLKCPKYVKDLNFSTKELNKQLQLREKYIKEHKLEEIKND